MKHHRMPESRVDIPAVIEAGLALRALGRTNANIKLHVPTFITELLGETYGRSLSVFILETVACIERRQRVADRFRSWRHSQGHRSRPLGKPDPIGTPSRAIRRMIGTIDVGGILSTVVAMRALDREGGETRTPRFLADLAAAFDGWASYFIWSMLDYAERDRRFARRFRSWRRAKAARAAAPPSRPKSQAKRR
jgi:hypothetical protein